MLLFNIWLTKPFRTVLMCSENNFHSVQKIVIPAARHEISIFSLPFVRKNNLQFDNQNKKRFWDVIYRNNTLPYTLYFFQKKIVLHDLLYLLFYFILYISIATIM